MKKLSQEILKLYKKLILQSVVGHANAKIQIVLKNIVIVSKVENVVLQNANVSIA